VKGHNTIRQGKQRIIAAPSYVQTGMYLCSTLSYDYRSRFDGPAAKNFNS
jgi:hypothetical protein